MIDRIRTLLQVRQLTPTQFADAIGIARPIVSHILSGRNKPSLEVVQKIIAAYPDLSLPWLLSGIGPMVAVSAPAAAVATPTPVSTSEGPEVPSKRLKSVVPAPAPAGDSGETAELPFVAVPQPVLASLPVVAVPAPSLVPVAEPVAAATPPPAGASTTTDPRAAASTSSLVSAFAEPGKRIRRIVIFYHDGTFGDYQPE